MTYSVKEVIQITNSSAIVAVDDRMQDIKIGMFLNGIEIKSLKRNNEDDNVDVYVKDKHNVKFTVGETVEVLSKEDFESKKGE